MIVLCITVASETFCFEEVQILPLNFLFFYSPKNSAIFGQFEFGIRPDVSFHFISFHFRFDYTRNLLKIRRKEKHSLDPHFVSTFFVAKVWLVCFVLMWSVQCWWSENVVLSKFGWYLGDNLLLSYKQIIIYNFKMEQTILLYLLICFLGVHSTSCTPSRDATDAEY